MNINGENVNIDDLISQEYMHKEIKKGVYLSDYQISILSMYGIDAYKCSSIDEILFQIEEILSEEDIEELDVVSKEIAEFNYYANTNK